MPRAEAQNAGVVLTMNAWVLLHGSALVFCRLLQNTNVLCTLFVIPSQSEESKVWMLRFAQHDRVSARHQSIIGSSRIFFRVCIHLTFENNLAKLADSLAKSFLYAKTNYAVANSPLSNPSRLSSASSFCRVAGEGGVMGRR